MGKYSDICREMGSCGKYLTDPIGKCQRHIRSFQGGDKSRIDKYLIESATYAAAKSKKPLWKNFNNSKAIGGILEWIESRKDGKRNRFPVFVDEENGIVKQPEKECFGLLEDVICCLYRIKQDGTLVAWQKSKQLPNELWRNPTPEEILNADDSVTAFGTDSSRRFWQADWRKRVEAVWGKACVVTGCIDRKLLRAAHIKRVSKSSTTHRLDEYNGLILAAHVDLAFEHGLITFEDSGKMIFSKSFSIKDRKAIGFPLQGKLPKVPKQILPYLQWHREFHGFQNKT